MSRRSEPSWNPAHVRQQINADLTAIVAMDARLPEEAEARAVSTDAGEIEALNLLGPVCNVEAWQHRYDTLEAAEARSEGLNGGTGTDSHPDLQNATGGDSVSLRACSGSLTAYASDQTAELHPLLVLATWEDVVRDERGQPSDLRATVQRAADYLRGSVDWMLGTNDDGDLNFLGVDALADDLRRCRRMLEDVLRDGERLTRVKVPCIRCDEAPAIAVRVDSRGREINGEWFCPGCLHSYSAESLLLAKSHSLAMRDGWVRVSDAAHVTGRSVKTIRWWATPPAPYAPAVRSRRVTLLSKLEVLWSDVRAMHQDTPTRQRYRRWVA